eukprot:TRINITY_DN11387_c0_g1_i1.p1 TRINITY_DN11387_c0_g1~~TRINITY_DN11387_c0_g1_i1.p1  ORF type:complete len:485 (+),score=65.30 TRINITY_DN11387_c0_g1_i1:76-1530(+)
MVHRTVACFALPALSNGFFATVDIGQAVDANQPAVAPSFLAAGSSYDATAVPSAAGDTAYQAMPPQNYAFYHTGIPGYPEGAAPGQGQWVYPGYPVFPGYSANSAQSFPGSYQPGTPNYPAQNWGSFSAATIAPAAALAATTAPAAALMAATAVPAAALIAAASPPAAINAAGAPGVAAVAEAPPADAALVAAPAAATAAVAPGVATAAATATLAAAGAAAPVVAGAPPLQASAAGAYPSYYMTPSNPAYSMPPATVGQPRPMMPPEGLLSATAAVAPAGVVSPAVATAASVRLPAASLSSRNQASLSNMAGVEQDSAADVALAAMEAKAAVEEGRAFAPSFPFQTNIVSPWELSTMAYKEQKPALAIVRTRHCPTCKEFVMNMNKHKKKMTSLLNQVIAVDISDDRGIDQSVWVANRGYNENYVPRVYMLDRKGDVMDIFAPRTDGYPYSYWKASQIQQNLQYLLGENITIISGNNTQDETIE